MSQYRHRWLAIALPVFLVMLLGASMVGAQDEPTPRTDSAAAAFAGAAANENVQGEVADVSIIDAAIRAADGRIRVIVELRSEPAAVTFARAGAEGGGAAAMAAADAQRALVDSEQAAFLASLAAAGINVERVSDTNTVINTIGVYVSPDQLAALRARPEVAAVYPSGRVERETASSIQQIGAPSAWNGTFGSPYTGDGMVISIIDSGVDYNHTNNGGPGGWPTDPALRQTLADGGFPNTKVVGGYDYVGDFYDANFPDPPEPDPDPMDCSINGAALIPTYGFNPGAASGHGSHVAGIAAGYGVNADGTTYTGGYASVPFGSLLIGPGAAPEASVLAMRVFGCFGSTGDDIVGEAIDDSVSGKYGAVADVINMSLGSNFGYGGDDPLVNGYYTATINNATYAGTLVVMSAGNARDTFFVTGSPGSTPAGLSVASTSDGGEGGILINGTQYPARPAVENKPLGIVGPASFVYLPGNGCARAQYATFPANTFAVVNWTGACGSTGLMTAAQDANLAGGVPPLGILVANNVANAFQNLTCGYRGTQPTPTYVSCVSVQQATGVFLAANPSAQITFDPSLAVVASTLADTVSDFSSRGPSRYASAGVKPEIAAPGDAITSTGAGTGNQPQVLGGTSMASPTVAGVAALAMQAHPSWSATQIKALLMNTANNDVFLGTTSGPRVGIQRAGSGRVDVPDLMTSEVIVYNADRPEVVGVNFGMPTANAGETITVVKRVRFQNKGMTAATYNLTIDTHSNANIAAYTVSPTTVTVAGLSNVDVNVTLTVTVPLSGTQTGNRSDASMQAVQGTTIGNFTRQYVTEETANLIATPTTGATVPLRLPLYAAPRSVSEMRSTFNPAIWTGMGSGAGNLPLSGKGVFDAASGFPQNVISSVTALEYTGSDSVGDTLFPEPSLDIQYTGIASTYNTAATPADSTVWLGISTVADWATPNEYFFIIYIDGNQNGFTAGPDDYEVYTSAPNLAGTTSRSDVFLSLAGLSSATSAFYHEFLNGAGTSFNTYLLNNNVISIPFYPYDLLNYDGNAATPTTSVLAAGDTTFNFYVEAFSRSLGSVDTTSVMSYNLADPAFDGTVGSVSPLWDDTNGNTIPFILDLANKTPLADGSYPAALLLHHHNEPNVLAANGQNFRRAEVVYFDADAVDIGVDKYASASSIVGGDELTYFIDVTNYSLGTIGSVTVTDVLPSSVTFQAASPACTHSGQPFGGTVTCQYLIDPLEAVTFYIDVTVDPLFIGNLSNTATASVDVLELDPSDNSDTVVVGVTPPAPVLIAPEGDIFSESPTFSWNDINGAGWYELTILRTPTQIFQQWYEKVAVCAAGICQVTPPVDHVPGEYEWYLRAWNEQSGNGPYSARMNYTITVAPETPTPIAPVGDITATNPLFTFSRVGGADSYYVWVSKTDGPSQGAVKDQWFPYTICDFVTNICTADLALTLGAGGYTWWVQSFSEFGGYSQWSAGTYFEVNVTPATPTPIAPIGAITTHTPTFTFSSIASGTWYYLWVSSGPNKIMDQWYSAGSICNDVSCSVTPGLFLETADYTWFIQTWSPFGGYSAWSAGTNFTVAIAPNAPVQVAPTGSILQTKPTYTFNRSAGATWYYVWVSGPSGYVLDQWVEASTVCSGNLCSLTPNVTLVDGVHRWWVQAWNAPGGYSAWTGPMIFNVNGPGAIGEPGVSPELPSIIIPDVQLPEAPIGDSTTNPEGKTDSR